MEHSKISLATFSLGKRIYYTQHDLSLDAVARAIGKSTLRIVDGQSNEMCRAPLRSLLTLLGFLYILARIVRYELAKTSIAT
jgi:hypothetical protein